MRSAFSSSLYAHMVCLEPSPKDGGMAYTPYNLLQLIDLSLEGLDAGLLSLRRGWGQSRELLVSATTVSDLAGCPRMHAEAIEYENRDEYAMFDSGRKRASIAKAIVRRVLECHGHVMVSCLRVEGRSP